MAGAVSALDIGSERVVNRAIPQLRITRIIIAHRESIAVPVHKVPTLNVATGFMACLFLFSHK